MIEFDIEKQTATMTCRVGEREEKFVLDLNEFKNNEGFRKAFSDDPSQKRLMRFLEYLDNNFKPEEKNPMSFRAQFDRFFDENTNLFLALFLALTFSQLEKRKKDVKKDVNDIKKLFLEKAKVLPEDYDKARKLSYKYHDGFDHITRDDDFIAVRSGNQLLEIIPLKGNDYNELKQFIRRAGDRILRPENLRKFEAVMRGVRREEALDLGRKAGDNYVKSLSKGITMRPSSGNDDGRR